MIALVNVWERFLDALGQLLFLIAIPATGIVFWKYWGDWKTVLLAIVAVLFASSLGQLVVMPLAVAFHGRGISQMEEGEYGSATTTLGIGRAIMLVGALIRVVAAGWIILRAVQAF